MSEGNFHYKSSIVIGSKINKLLVLERILPHTERNSSLRSTYLCRCDCGKEIIVIAKNLQRKKCKPDCGCGSYERACDAHRILPFGEAAFNKLVGSYRYNSKKRKLQFELSDELCRKLFKGNCYYCGKEPEQKFIAKHCWGEYIFNGIDRSDNKLGYIPNNVVSCCWNCNNRKSDANSTEFLDWISKVYHNIFINPSLTVV